MEFDFLNAEVITLDNDQDSVSSKAELKELKNIIEFQKNEIDELNKRYEEVISDKITQMRFLKTDLNKLKVTKFSKLFKKYNLKSNFKF